MGWEGLDQYRAQLQRELDQEFGVVVRTEKKRVGLAMFQAVDLLTPVNIGEARAGWHVSVDRTTGEDVQGQDVLATLASAVDEAPADASLYLQNYVPHMVVIDQGLYEHDTPPGGSKALHVPLDRRDTVAGKTLVVGGFHVSAPKGVAGVAADQVAADFGLTRTTEN